MEGTQTTDRSAEKPGALPDVTGCDTSGDHLNDDTGLTERQEAALLLLVNGKSIAHISNKLGVHRQTLWRWRRDPAFARELRRRREVMWSDVACRVQGLLEPALDVVESQLHDRYDRARYRAATFILNLSNVRKMTPPEDEDEDPPM